MNGPKCNTDLKVPANANFKWELLRDAYKTHYDRKHIRKQRRHDYTDLLLPMASDSEEWTPPQIPAEAQPLLGTKGPLAVAAKRSPDSSHLRHDRPPTQFPNAVKNIISQQASLAKNWLGTQAFKVSKFFN